MKFVRTPEERFTNLKAYPFLPNYVEIDSGDGGSLRMHYVDEGSGPTILCLHGQPSWSYLYRKMIPSLVRAGHRVIAPDLIGFGKSDKPVNRQDYTYANHVGWMKSFLERLGLSDLTLVCQDWGALIGLRLVAEESERFSGVVVSNAGLPDGSGIPPEAATKLRQLQAVTPALSAEEQYQMICEPPSDRPGFFYWVRHCDEHPDFHPAEIMRLLLRECDEEEYRAWAAPFPSEQYLAGARQFPSLVPILPDDPAIADNKAAWEVLERFDKPFLTAFGDSDPVTRGVEKLFIKRIPGAAGQKHAILEGAGHFSQDDTAEEFANIVIDFIDSNSSQP
jgi:haloalkane dehalogenase